MKLFLHSRALIFKKSDIDKFAKDYVVFQMPDSKTLLEKSYSISYNSKSVDIQGGKIILDLDFSYKIYQNIDKNSLISSFGGMTASQINDSINNNFGDQVSKVKVNLWPFWVTKAPRSQKIINVELKFE